MNPNEGRSQWGALLHCRKPDVPLATLSLELEVNGENQGKANEGGIFQADYRQKISFFGIVKPDLITNAPQFFETNWG